LKKKTENNKKLRHTKLKKAKPNVKCTLPVRAH